MSREPIHFVQSLARGLNVLQAFSAERPRLTLTELGQATGMNKAAVQRLTDTLISLGFLGRNRYKEYYLGPKVLSLGYAYLQGSELREMAGEHLRRFSERTGHTVNLCVLDDTEVVVVFRREVKSFFKFDVQAGSRLPAYCTSMGKVLLAALPDAELKARVRRIKLAPLTPHTITDRDKLWRELMQVRQRGWATGDREASLALYSLAVPLIGQRGRVKATMNVSVFAEQAEPSLIDKLRGELFEQGRRLSELMGYQGPYPALPVGLDEDDD
jgi:IclR family pca regulon transcriptional regulator